MDEAAMSSNLMLTYGGCTPTQAVFGYVPACLYDPEVDAIGPVIDAASPTPDVLELALRCRLQAKEAILQSIVEDRLARAQHTKVHQHKPEDLAKLVDGATIDLWREPDSKDEEGWRGPATLLKLYRDRSRTIVEW